MPDARTERVGVAAGAVVLATLVFRRLLFGSRVYVALDYALLHVPFRHEIARAVAARQVPLWTSGMWSGAPFLANGDTATLYPLQLFFFLTDPPRAIGIVLWAHVALALVTMYAFARLGLGAGPTGAAVAAVVYAFNGYAMTHTGFLHFVYLQPWPPLVFLAVELATRRSLRWCALGAVAVAMAVFTGQPQQLYLALLWLPALAIARTRQLWRPLAAITIVVVGGVALGAAQAIPEAEYVRMSDRGGGLDLEAASFGALPFESPLEFLLPDYDRSYFGENAGWVGATGLAFAVAGCVVLARKRRWPELGAWSAMAVVSFVLALGTATPLFELVLRTVPGAAQFRFPVRWVYLVTFAIACLAAYGADHLVALRGTRRRRSARAGAAIVTALFATAAIAVVAWNAEWETGDRVLATTVVAVMGVVAATAVRMTTDDTRLRAAAAAGLVAMVVLELVPADWRLEWNHPGTREAYTPGRFAAIVAASPLHGRVLSVASPAPDEQVTAARRLAAATPMLADLTTVTGLGGLGAPGQGRLVEQLVAGPLTYDDEATARRDEVWRGLGVQWLVARPSQAHVAANPALRPVAEQDGFVLYELDGGGTRARTYCGVRAARDDRDAAEWALGDAYTTDRLTVTAARAQPGGACGTARVTHSSRHSVDVAADLPNDGWLLLADTWYPGWRATVDGKATRIHRGNGFYRAVTVPAGAHDVRFRYVPGSFRAGAAVSIVSWAALAALAAYWASRRNRSTASSMTSGRLQNANRTSVRPPPASASS